MSSTLNSDLMPFPESPHSGLDVALHELRVGLVRGIGPPLGGSWFDLHERLLLTLPPLVLGDAFPCLLDLLLDRYRGPC